MQCPRCQYEHESQTTECLKCGIIFEKYLRLQQPVAPPSDQVAEIVDEEPKRDFWPDILAFPIALIVARVFVGIAPGIVRLLTMWVHECGHAITAWLSGFWAMPGPWFTPVADERSIGVTLFVGGAIAFLGFRLWKMQRWPLFAAVVAVLLFQVVCTLMSAHKAQALIIFGGDAGCMVLGAALMSTFYFHPDSATYQNQLRWGFLAIGAASLIDAFKTWSGSEDDLPFGVQEGFLSDPSQLVQTYGWPIHVMMDRFHRLGLLCLVFLAVLWVWNFVQHSKAKQGARIS